MSVPFDLLGSSGFLPHGYCLTWSPTLLWTMVISDAVITLSYYSIPLALVYFVRRNRALKLKFDWIFLMFGAFIFACGTTHAIAILNIWRPEYWLDAWIKLGTAIISLATAIFLWPLLPKVSQFIRERRQAELDLDAANQRLTDSLAQLRRRTRELDTLGRLGPVLQRIRSADELAQVVARAAAELSIAEAGTVLLKDADSSMRIAAQWGDPELTGAEFRRRDAGGDPPATSALTSTSVPLCEAGESLGLLQLRGVAQPDDPHVSLLIQTLAGRASAALSNLRLREHLLELSVRDPLTGLFNRRHLDHSLPVEERRSRTKCESIGVVTFDLDHFKRLNDRHGHEVGDVALSAFARILRETSREADIACRTGGEEFVLLLPGTDLDGARVRAERVREAMAAQRLEHQGRCLPQITVSAGVAAFPQSGANLAEALRAADRALYRAKGDGRNRCVVAPRATDDPAGTAAQAVPGVQR
ncbi:GGDEF domain-containing protein [Sinimarinibacterium thermocellulolyticum]|uniref:diguanylate cyclase n=1 Tax=Sinimarinibacterium thermocellulolyticum TaxID=3170016 RepID=A0ABV2ACY7_9GAMM